MKKMICLMLCVFAVMLGGCVQKIPTAETTGQAALADDDSPSPEAYTVSLPDDLPALPDSFVMHIPDSAELAGNTLEPAMRLAYNAALWCASENDIETAYSEEGLERLESVNLLVTDSMFDGKNGVVLLEYPTGMHQADYYFFTTHDRAKTWTVSCGHDTVGLQLLGMQTPYVYCTFTSEWGGGLCISVDGGESFSDVALFDLLPAGTVGESQFSDGTVKDFRISETDGTISFDLFGFNTDDPSVTFHFILDPAAETCLSCVRTEDTETADNA